MEREKGTHGPDWRDGIFPLTQRYMYSQHSVTPIAMIGASEALTPTIRYTILLSSDLYDYCSAPDSIAYLVHYMGIVQWGFACFMKRRQSSSFAHPHNLWPYKADHSYIDVHVHGLPVDGVATFMGHE